jgi:hypothetical protein
LREKMKRWTMNAAGSSFIRGSWAPESFKPQNRVRAGAAGTFAANDKLLALEPSRESHPIAGDAPISAAPKARQRRSLTKKFSVADFEPQRAVRLDREILDEHYVVVQPVLAGTFQSIHDSAPAALDNR